MPASPRCETLLSPSQMKHLQLKNRVVKAPQASGNATSDGAPTDGALQYYESLAKGGVGLIIVEGAAVEFPIGAVGWPRLGIQTDEFIPLYRQLTDLIHSYGAKAFLEIQHAGPSHPKAMANLQPVAPAALAGADKPVAIFADARGMDLAEIKNVQLQFVAACERAQKAGFDGVDLHGAHRYLINAFMSPAWNKRSDEYGPQDMTTRARFAVEIIQAVKQRLGADFPVGIRYNIAEWGLKGGITAEEGVAFGKLFESAGADFLDVSGYGFGTFLWGYWGEQLRAFEPAPEVQPWLKTIDDPGFIVAQAAQVKKAVSIPVISGGRIEPKVADDDLKRGDVDLAFFARRLIADPSFPNKIAEGRAEDVAPCTACSECWDSTTAQHRSVQCRINASVGREREYEITPAARQKKVLVVGGGPAGMEAARVAALRGHGVLLYEKEHQLGGQLPLAAMIKGTEIEDLGLITEYLTTQLTKLGITIRLGAEVTPAVVEAVKPDVVVLAVGGVAATPGIPGIDRKIVLSASALHRQARSFLRVMGPSTLRTLTNLWMPLGKRVVILGGALQGCQLAEFLVHRGRQVTILETTDKFGSEMVTILAERLIKWLNKKGVTMIGGVKYEEITDAGITITDKEGKQQAIEADSILVALPLAANTELQTSLAGRVGELYSIGDCREPHRIIHAIHDGARVARLI